MSYTKIVPPMTIPSGFDAIRRDADGAVIPADPGNTDWQTYQGWLAQGNTPAEAFGPPPARILGRSS